MSKVLTVKVKLFPPFSIKFQSAGENEKQVDRKFSVGGVDPNSAHQVKLSVTQIDSHSDR